MHNQQLLPLPHHHSGKVRDTYLIPNHPQLLFPVASNRISTHNETHLTLIPTKGEVLTALTLFWTLKVLDDVNTHLHAWGSEIYRFLPRDVEYPKRLQYHSFVVTRQRPDPREFIYRKYLTGTLFTRDYNPETGANPYGLPLEPGLGKMHCFAEPIFTPTRKSKNDPPVKTHRTLRQYPEASKLTSEVFRRMNEYLKPRNITLIDSKFEAAGNMLIDEWGTGDCSRMAWTDRMVPGKDPEWLDKEYFRQLASKAWGGGKKYPIAFSEHDVDIGIRRYYEAFEAITGMTLDTFQRKYMQ